MTGQFGIKIVNLMKMTPKFKIDDTFFIGKDCEGWTNGMMADFTNQNTELVRAMAILRKDKCTRLKLTKEDGIEMLKLMPKEEDLANKKEVIDIEFDLEYKAAVLKSEFLEVAVNPKFLKYWFQFYQTSTGVGYASHRRWVANHDIKFLLADKLEPVTVLVDGKITGVIMPIRRMEDQ